MERDSSFYRDLPAFTDFSDLVENSHFKAAPKSWNVVITDIKGSIKAIQAGRYKDVNMLGAACIACVANALESSEFPFVFGGDGSTMLISNEDLASATRELVSLKSLAEREFGLELRVGVVPTKLLYDRGVEVLVGKYELSPGNYTAQFKGGGLTLAENLIKQGLPGARLLEFQGESAPPQLNGLSCRISPIRSNKGTVLSLLVKPKADKNGDKVIERVLADFLLLLNTDFKNASPVRSGGIKWTWPPQTLNQEIKFQKGQSSTLSQFFHTLFRTLIAWLMLNLNISAGGFDPFKYKKELILNSDFKKFDETLRMVIDCTLDQASAIEAFLEKIYKEGLVFYGTHRSSHALLTCMVRSVVANNHIHFVDGSGGGYAFAALQMKAQT